MATAAVQQPSEVKVGQVIEPLVTENTTSKHNVATELNYYKDPGDGTLPAPVYVG